MSAPGNSAPAASLGAQLYEARKLAELCTRCGKEPQSGDSLLGAKCREKKNKWQAKAAKKRRKRWAKQGRCTRCGRKRIKSGQLAGWCPACAVELGKLRLSNVRQHVRRGAPIARTDGFDERAETDGYERRRYRGQGKRGRQPAKQLDEQDLVAVATHIAAGVLGLVEYYTPEVQAAPRAAQAETKQEALSDLDRGLRYIQDVLARHRYIRPTVDSEED